jgi:hypothetical protein
LFRGKVNPSLLAVVAWLLLLPATANAVNVVSFSPGPTLAQKREGAGAALLPDGKALIVGGAADSVTYLDSTELYDPATNSFSAGPTLPAKLYGPAVASLPDGRVLIAGGFDGDLGDDVKTARTFNPQTGTFTPVGDLHVARELAGAASLGDGRVLIVGGFSNSSGSVNSTEIFNSTTNAFSDGPTYPQPVYGLALAPIAGGRALAAGGLNSHPSNNYVTDASIFGSGTFNPIGALPFHDFEPATAALPGGRALLAGGNDDTIGDVTTRASIFDPATNTFSSNGIGNLIGKRAGATAVELSDGRVLVAGGQSGGARLATTEILSVPSNSFKSKLKGRKVKLAVSTEGTAQVTDVGTQVATTAKKKKPKLVKTVSKHGGPGTIVVKIKLTKQGNGKLRQKGKLRLRVVYAPDGGVAATKKLKLKG